MRTIACSFSRHLLTISILLLSHLLPSCTSSTKENGIKEVITESATSFAEFDEFTDLVNCRYFQLQNVENADGIEKYNKGYLIGIYIKVNNLKQIVGNPYLLFTSEIRAHLPVFGRSGDPNPFDISEENGYFIAGTDKGILNLLNSEIKDLSPFPAMKIYKKNNQYHLAPYLVDQMASSLESRLRFDGMVFVINRDEYNKFYKACFK